MSENQPAERAEEGIEATKEAAASASQPVEAGPSPEESSEPIPQERIRVLEQELAEWRDRCLRAHAELDNLRKRLEREAEQSRRFANEAILVDLLPVLDSLERGLAAGLVDAATLREGMELTLRQLIKALEAHGVRILDPQGEAFDPRFHQAVATQPAKEVEADRVLAVVQKGMLLRERLLRPALVVVSAGTAEAS
ncbi:MAG: protein GrpE [Lysobacterales bacterium]|jgi:molecular chaperone GrpE|nr:MAG: protein GrpE [Xanthomonadales bacterium]